MYGYADMVEQFIITWQDVGACIHHPFSLKLYYPKTDKALSIQRKKYSLKMKIKINRIIVKYFF